MTDIYISDMKFRINISTNFLLTVFLFLHNTCTQKYTFNNDIQSVVIYKYIHKMCKMWHICQKVCNTQHGTNIT